MAPTLGPARISLDHESHFRDIPADVTPKEAKAIAGKLIELVPDAAAPKVTREQVKTAVAAVRPKTGHPPGGSARPDVPASIEAEIADLAPPPAKVTDAETRGGDAERAAQVASAVEEYDGLIPPEDLPDDERQSWQDCLQKLGKEVCGMAEYYRRWPGAARARASVCTSRSWSRSPARGNSPPGMSRPRNGGPNDEPQVGRQSTEAAAAGPRLRGLRVLRPRRPGLRRGWRVQGPCQRAPAGSSARPAGPAAVRITIPARRAAGGSNRTSAPRVAPPPRPVRRKARAA